MRSLNFDTLESTPYKLTKTYTFHCVVFRTYHGLLRIRGDPYAEALLGATYLSLVQPCFVGSGVFKTAFSEENLF